MSVDILKSCVDGFDSFVRAAVEQFGSSDIENDVYTAKALTFDAATVLAIADVALFCLGAVNLPAALLVLGISLLGREIAQQSMSPSERGFGHIFSQRVSVPFSDRSLARAGNTVLFYDTVPSLRDLAREMSQGA
jgi:hypothetical protein